MNITMINPCFKTPEILNYIADLITDYGYDHYDDLSYGDRCELTAKLLEVEGYEMACQEMFEHFKKSLIDFKTDEDFLFEFKQTVIKQYDEIMQALFIYTYDEYVEERQTWLKEIGCYGNPDICEDQLQTLEVTL